MAAWKILTLVGLSLNTAGVIRLFFYVLPRRERTGGTLINIQGVKPNQELIRLERRWDLYSGVGLACVIIGIVLQGLGVWIAP
jgi:hypothetical protein